MNVLFLSSTHAGVVDKGIYSDLMLYFATQGHTVTIAYSSESPSVEVSDSYVHDNIRYVMSKSAKLTKNKNMIQKGIATITFDAKLKRTIKKELANETYDIVLYATPPVTIVSTLKYLHKTNPNAFFYLMLKDIFPQNAVDLNIMGKGIIYRYFKHMEKQLYALSDFIGTMSPRNLDYIVEKNPDLADKVEVLPNTTSLNTDEGKPLTRNELGLPENKKLLFYGGNLGLPQSVPFILECYEKIKDREDLGFVIVGSGAQADLITDYIANEKPQSLYYFKHKPHHEYIQVMAQCDVGLVFLDHKFTIPNYPQRILAYMAQSMPIICATDESSDIGTIAVANNYGFAVSSNDSSQWLEAVDELINNPDKAIQMGEAAFTYLKNHYTSDKAYDIIMKHMEV
ncbi:glycosyltransferase family 4 protein [Erysipelothrix aquatica]|uniref:glycosyltransferase family 4 protein n=1 Tax=Erysipelothrix aquatica TaxID=2683714 RepID=UPI00135C6D53|nr:glycosyltransferase family 4 protein [Erysipelothrix aquatica]